MQRFSGRHHFVTLFNFHPPLRITDLFKISNFMAGFCRPARNIFRRLSAIVFDDQYITGR